MDKGKSLVTSKTFWVNAVTGVAEVMGLWKGVIPAEYAPYLIAAQATLNIILRLVTNQPITSAL